MNLIDKDKLLYELSCAVLSECSQDEYEHIEDIINEQPMFDIDNHITNIQRIRKMSTESLAQFMFDCGVGCCDCCKYKNKCSNKSHCKYSSTTNSVEIIKDWLESNYD